MEHNVVTLETAKKLKAAGYPQETYFSWDESDRPEPDYFAYVVPTAKGTFILTAAPTAAELADQLPKSYTIINDRLGLRASSNDTAVFYGDTMAEALASLYLKLKEGSNE